MHADTSDYKGQNRMLSDPSRMDLICIVIIRIQTISAPRHLQYSLVILYWYS